MHDLPFVSGQADASSCLVCGACCAAFRVSFYWAEADDGGGTVPHTLTESFHPHLRCMRGTWAPAPRCVALQGEVGQGARCSIYPLRPSPCRALQAGTADCARARARHGLPPLLTGVAAKEMTATPS